MKINQDIVTDIIKHHLGKTPKGIQELAGGFANFVYEAKVEDETFIVRISDELFKLQFFLKEQWAVQKARENKVPVPEILEVGNEASNYPYMIVRKVEGYRAEYQENRRDVIKEMGKYLAIINSIPTSGYGHVFDWSSNQLSRKDTWADYLIKELEVEERMAILERHKIINEEGMSSLRSALKEVMKWTTRPTLNHGDMRLKNVILNEKGKIKAILDWEACTSNIAPQWDLSISMHDLSIDERQIFLKGYGLSEQEFRNRSQGMKVLNILNYAPYVELAYENKEKDLIEIYKTRLRGAHDWFSI